MLKSAALSLLEQKKDALLASLKQIHFQSQSQQDILSQGEPDAIQKLAEEKKEKGKQVKMLLDAIIATLQDIQSRGDPADKENADRFIFHLKNESQVVLREIIEIEARDNKIISGLKDKINFEILEIESVRDKLKGIKTSYAHPDKEPFLFDKQG